MVALYCLISYYLVFAKSWQSGLNMKGKVQGFIQMGVLGGGGGGSRPPPTQDIWWNPPTNFLLIPSKSM